MSIKFPNLFAGATLVAPFFRHYTDVLDKYKWVYKFFNLVEFYVSFSNRSSASPTYLSKYAYYFDDPKLVHMTKLNTICYFLDEQEWTRAHIAEQRTPMLIVTAEKDTVVRNNAITEILNKVKNPQN